MSDEKFEPWPEFGCHDGWDDDWSYGGMFKPVTGVLLDETEYNQARAAINALRGKDAEKFVEAAEAAMALIKLMIRLY